MCVCVCLCVCVCVCECMVRSTQHLEVMDCYSIPNRVRKVGGGFYRRAGRFCDE